MVTGVQSVCDGANLVIVREGIMPSVEPKQTESRIANLITVSQAARIIGIAPANVRSAIYRGTLPGVKVGSFWLVPIVAAEDYKVRNYPKHRKGASPRRKR